jgi:cation transport regulator ChaC
LRPEEQSNGDSILQSSKTAAVQDETEGLIWYFSYGSNMNRGVFVDRRAMHPLQTRPARLDDYRLCFDLPVGPGERGVANLEPHAGAHTWGVLYLITAAEFDHLDRTEGVPSSAYRRLPISVLIDDAQLIAAFTYQSDKVRPGRKPSPRYIGLLIEGAREHGLPSDYIQFLQSVELARDERLAGPDRP